jgi:peptidoglycan hydrolase CwlO-like protein
MSKIVLAFMLVFALVLSGCGNGLDNLTGLDTTNDDYKIDGLQRQLNSVNQAVGGDTTVIEGIQDNVAGLQIDVENLKKQIEVLQADSVANAAAIAELQAECDAKQAAIDAMKIDIAALQKEVKDLQSEVYNIQEMIVIYGSAIDNNTTTIAEIQASLDELTDKVSSLSRKIVCLFSKLNALAGAAATFGLTPPVGDLGVGFYLDITTGWAYQWNGESWVKLGQLQTVPPPDVDPLKAPMFVIADGLSGGKVKVTWTGVEGAKSYIVYAMRYCNGVISTASVGQTSDLSITFNKSVGTIVPVLTVIREDGPPSFGDAYDLAYVVVAVDADGNQGNSSYAVGPLTGNPH